MGLRSTAIFAIGVVFLAAAAVQTMCEDKRTAIVRELDALPQRTRKLMEGSKTKEEMEEEPKKLAYIVPCFPPHIHPDARIRREGHKPMSYAHVPKCENGTECRMLDSKRCGLQKECKDFIQEKCTEYEYFSDHRGTFKQCVKSTTEIVTKCKEFKVCTMYACLPPEPPSPPMSPAVGGDPEEVPISTEPPVSPAMAPEREETPVSPAMAQEPEVTPVSPAMAQEPEETPVSPALAPEPDVTPLSPALAPEPDVTPLSPALAPGPEVTPLSPALAPGPEVTPLSPALAPGPEVTPLSPAMAPEPEVTPGAPEPSAAPEVALAPAPT